MIKFEDKEFKKEDITRLYPAAIIKTGYNNETTPISLDWVDEQLKEGKSVDILKYAIFFHTKDNAVTTFSYEDREELEKALDLLSTYF